MIKKILAGIAGVIVLLLIVALFVGKKYSLERQIIINKPPTEVYSYIKYLKNQNNFSKWAQMDPNMTKTFRGTDATPGFVSAWDSNNKDVGKGEQEITSLSEGKRVDYEIRFIKPFEAVAKSYMITADNGNNTTTVKWGFASQMPYPMNLTLLFINMEDMLGKDLDEGLNNLKSQLEK